MPEPVHTRTSDEQEATEVACRAVFERWLNDEGHLERGSVSLQKQQHVTFLLAGLRELSVGYTSLDASRPWLCYWVMHSLEMLGEARPPELEQQMVDFLASCQDPRGGFCGGPFPGQAPHLAPTYAAVNAL
eukprot:6311718-Prymnesium_polylepis.1